MAKLKKAVLNFKPSGSSDVTEYKLYIEESPTEVTYSSQSIDLGYPLIESDGYIKIDLSTLPNMTTKDGIYNLGISSIDDAGNESSIMTIGLENVPLDFVAPDPPLEAFVTFI